jgi:hypothetical protein
MSRNLTRFVYVIDWIGCPQNVISKRGWDSRQIRLRQRKSSYGIKSRLVKLLLVVSMILRRLLE